MTRSPVLRDFARVAGLLLATTLTLPASAQASGAPVQTGSGGGSEGWQVMGGAVTLTQARYPGSRDTRIEGFPLVLATRGRWFVGHMPGSGLPLGAGAFLLQGEGGHLGLALGSGIGKLRREADSPRLQGLGDIDSTPRASLFASGSLAWMTVRGHVSGDIGGKDQGLEAAVDLVSTLRITATFSLSAGPGLTWGDAKDTQTSFGVDSGQSARSGLKRFTASGGISAARFSVGAELRLTERWNLGATVVASGLQGDAARSPITEVKNRTSAALYALGRW